MLSELYTRSFKANSKLQFSVWLALMLFVKKVKSADITLLARKDISHRQKTSPTTALDRGMSLVSNNTVLAQSSKLKSSFLLISILALS